MKEIIEDSDEELNGKNDISTDLINNRRKSLNPKDKLNNISLAKSHEEEIATNFGDFVLMMDNKEDYRKALINSAKKKIRKVIRKIKKTKDVSKKYKDPSSTKWYIINPDRNKIKPFFDSLFYLLLYIDFILSPFEFFVYQSKYKYIRIISFDIFFTLEIISHFFISYYDASNKYYVTDMKKISKNYLKSGFFPSLSYVFPFYIFHSDLEMFRFIKLYRYPFVNYKFKRLIIWLLSFIIKNITIVTQIVRVFTFFISICFIVHICACFYCYLGLTFKDGWLYAHSDAVDTTSIIDIYVSSYYFLAETLSSTGYGDLTPSNYAELAFIMFCEIINCGLYAYLLSNILDILLNKDNSNSYKYRASQLNLENWIMYYMKKLPSSSRKDNLHRNKIWNETKKYFELYYNPTKNFGWIQDKNFITQLKPSQRKELMLKAFNGIFNKFHSFFKRIILLSSKIKIVMNYKTSIQVAKTEITNNMKKMHKIYFIDKGIVNIYKNGEQIFSLTEGYFFGIESLLLDNENKDDKISYIVSNECPFAILFTIDIPYLIQEILNYDSESFIEMIKLSNIYIDNILKGKNTDIFLKERQESFDEILEKSTQNVINIKIKKDTNKIDNNIINTNSESAENDDDIIVGDNIVKKRKINCDLLQPGYFPELNVKLAEYQRANNVIDESNLKIDLVNKQIHFINKYIDSIINK